MTNQDECRRAFEEWVTDGDMDCPSIERFADGGYKLMQTYSYWIAWQAAWNARPRSLEGQRFTIDHDGFTGTVIGSYTRLDGEQGSVLQQDGTKVVHVYRNKWLRPAAQAAIEKMEESDG